MRKVDARQVLLESRADCVLVRVFKVKKKRRKEKKELTFQKRTLLRKKI